jgi:hypothetical protein
MSSSTRLRRAVLVVVLAISVLSMHGLATTYGEHGREHSSASEALDGVALGTQQGRDIDHGLMHTVGELCLWLIVAGIVVTVGARRACLMGRRHTASYHPRDRRATPPQAAGRSPDSSLTGIALRC